MAAGNQTFRQYVQLLFARQRKRISLSVLVMLASGLSSGCGFLLLVPLLQGLESPGVSPPQFAGTVGRLFDVAGLELTLPSVLLVYLVLAACYVLSVRGQELLNARIEQDFTETLRNEVFAAVSYANWQFVIGRRRSDFAHALAAETRRVGDGTIFLLRLINAAVIAFTHLLVCVAISPAMSVLTLASGAALGLLLRHRHGAVRVAGERASRLNRGFFANVAEHLAGLKEARSFAAEHRHVDAFEQLTAEMKSEHLRYVRTRSTTALLHSLGAMILLCGMLYLAVSVFAVALSELAVLVLVFARLMPRLQDLHSCSAHLIHMLPAFDSLQRLHAQCERFREPAAADQHDSPRLEREVRMSGVGFRYEPDGEWVLRDVNLIIPARTITVIIGPSGAGKSTLADVLIGLLSPGAGEIRVDGQPLNGPNLCAWRARVGYVPQETFLLHDSIAANLRWANSTASDDDLWEALELAAADDFVRALPRGLETKVGDRGTRLSGGQRQRLALARAFVRRPSLLVLDEATSSLDPANQDRIQATIQALRGRLTILVIAHHLPAVQWADQVVVVEAGAVVEAGSYEELAAREQGRVRALLQTGRVSAAASFGQLRAA